MGHSVIVVEGTEEALVSLHICRVFSAADLFPHSTPEYVPNHLGCV